MENRYEDVYNYLSKGSYPPQNGNLFYGVENKRRAIKSKEEAMDLFKEFHTSSIEGHPDILKTQAALCSRFYWSGMTVDIHRWVSECVRCQRVGPTLRLAKTLGCIKMESGQLSRAEALACSGCRQACHVMLYADTKSKLFGRTPIRHVVLMQMRFDGLLGFPGGLVNPSEETLEAGLSRELLEELGVAVPVSEEDLVDSRFAPAHSGSSSRLITHFYVKKMEEEQIREVEKAAVSTAVDHGLEVMGMVRVPLYTTKHGGGLSFFLSHSFIGTARSMLIDSLLRFHLISPGELQKALRKSLLMQAENAKDLKSSVALMEVQGKQL